MSLFPQVRDAFYVLVGVLLIARALQDSFKVVLLPRAARSRSRAVRGFYSATWFVWSYVGRLIRHGRTRDNFLAVYGPLSMVALFASWTLMLILGFGILQWVGAPGSADDWVGLRRAILLSGDMFFTLGSVSAELERPAAHALAVAEAGLGFGFIALTIGYLPVLYGHFSSREAYLLRFRVRAAPNWTAHDMLHFYEKDGPQIMARWLRDCELWIADMMVSHNSYPMLAFYRSQREDPSWLSAIATILDVCAIIRVAEAAAVEVQLTATYAAAVGFLIDLNASLGLSGGAFEPREVIAAEVVPGLARALGKPTPDDFEVDFAHEIERVRAIYEPELSRLSAYLLMPLPPLSIGVGGDDARHGTR